MLMAGGPLMAPIALASFVMLLVVFERMISLRRRRVVPRLFVERLLLQLREGALDRADALARCDTQPSHVARVFTAALRKWGKPAVEVEQALLDEGERVGNVLRRYLRVINGVATVSPLLGLLGTVWGMMQAFNAIAGSSAIGRPELLAGGHQRRAALHRGRTHRGHSGADLLPVLRRSGGRPGDGHRPLRPGTGEPDLGRGVGRTQDHAQHRPPPPGSVTTEREKGRRGDKERGRKRGAETLAVSLSPLLLVSLSPCPSPTPCR